MVVESCSLITPNSVVIMVGRDGSGCTIYPRQHTMRKWTVNLIGISYTGTH